MRLAFVLEAIDKATATVTKVNARIDKLTEPARRVRAAFGSLVRESRFDRISSAVDNVGQRFGALRERVSGILSAVTVGLTALAGLGYGFKRVADGADQLNDTAQMLGITTQELQRMGYAAQLNGSSTDEMSESLRFLSRNMIDAVNGSSEMQMWFTRLGISQERLRKMNVVQVYEAIADKFQKVGDSGQNAAKKIAVMTTLLGRSGASQKQILDQGSEGLKKFYEEADALGVVLDTKTVDAMGSFNDAWDRMRLTVFGASATILGSAAPVLEKLLGQLTAWAGKNKAVMATRFAEWVERMATRLPAFFDAASRVADGLGRMLEVADKVAKLLGGWENLFAVLVGVMGVQLVTAVGGLVTAVWGLNAAMVANPIGAMVTAVSLLVALLPLLILHWDKVIQKMREVNDAVPSWLKYGSPLLGGLNMAVSALSPKAAGAESGMPGQPGLQSQAQALGGTLKITIDQDGKAKVSELKKAPYSPLDIDVSYAGQNMALGF